MLTREQIDDKLREHRDFLRKLHAWLDFDPSLFDVRAEIATFLRFIDE